MGAAAAAAVMINAREEVTVDEMPCHVRLNVKQTATQHRSQL